MKILSLLITAIVLTGCATSPKYDKLEVSKVDVVYVTIPEELLTPCKPEKPLDRESYLKLKTWEREQVLTEYSVSLLKTIKECNININKIKDLNNSAPK